MAPGTAAPDRFCGGGRAADRLSIGVEAAGDPSAGADGPIFAAGVLRASAILLRGAHADGQRVDAERMAANRVVDGDIRGDAGHRKSLLEERGQARTPARNENGNLSQPRLSNRPIRPGRRHALARRTDRGSAACCGYEFDRLTNRLEIYACALPISGALAGLV